MLPLAKLGHTCKRGETKTQCNTSETKSEWYLEYTFFIGHYNLNC